MNDVIAWAAPIASTLIVCAGQLLLNQRFKRADEKHDEDRKSTDEKRKAEAEWRSEVDKLMQEQGTALQSVANDREDWYAWRAEMIAQMQAQDERINTVLQAQCTQMRSDIIHKCHRYLDDLGRASTEEKEALSTEHSDYSAMCAANDIVNNFVDKLVERVMQLPEREI